MSTEPSSDPPLLTEDVIFCVTDFLATTADFLAVSETCRTWRAPGQIAAYRDRTVTVSPNDNRWLARHLCLGEFYPTQAGYVRTLKLTGPEDDTSFLEFNTVVDALRHFPNIHTLTIAHLSWRTEHLVTPRPTFPTLNHLIMHDVCLLEDVHHQQLFQPLALKNSWASVQLGGELEVFDGADKPSFSVAVEHLLVANEEGEPHWRLLDSLPTISAVKELELVYYAADLYGPTKSLVLDNKDTLHTFVLDISAAEPSNDPRGISISFVKHAHKLKELTVVLPLYDFADIEFGFESPIFFTDLCDKLLEDVGLHLPPKVTILRIQFITLAFENGGKWNVRKRMRLQWARLAARLARHPTLRSVEINMTSWFKVEKEPGWPPELLLEIGKDFELFSIHYCFGTTLYTYKTLADAQNLFNLVC
ncbi:hypothetical protein EIP86_008421 [Pleurotus ostreatoroseus]|nr:hypothetical protein EIP86_008421 [Pleurotus ostreatoroseus]